MTPLLLLFAQASAPVAANESPASQTPPAIEIRTSVRADRVDVKDPGTAEVKLDGSPGAVPSVHTDRNIPKGQSTYRNLELEYRASVTLEPPVDESETAPETVESQQQGD